jgi:allantoin racemase
MITVVDAVIPVLHTLADEYGLSSSMGAVRAVNVPVLRLRESRDEVIDKMVEVGRECLAEGADVLVLGCMTMGFLDVAATLQSEIGTPVVNPVDAALHTAQMFLGLQQVKSLTSVG